MNPSCPFCVLPILVFEFFNFNFSFYLIPSERAHSTCKDGWRKDAENGDRGAEHRVAFLLLTWTKRQEALLSSGANIHAQQLYNANASIEQWIILIIYLHRPVVGS